MASFPAVNPTSYKADGAISRGMAVKAGSDKSHVAKATAATQKILGIALDTTTAAEDCVDVAHPGGGAPGLLGGTVVAGDFLTADSAGKLVATTTANDHVVGQALEGGDANEIIGILVLSFNY